MAEPTSAGIAGVIGAAGGAALLSALGIEPQPLLWALIGATLGLTAAPQSSRFRACCVFVCAVLASALLGTWIATALADASTRKLATSGASLVMGALFQPVFTSASAAVPQAVKSLLRRVGLGEQS
jgi:hypothetical protein